MVCDTKLRIYKTILTRIQPNSLFLIALKNKKHFDIIICGGGAAGLLLAHGLINNDAFDHLSIALIEKEQKKVDILVNVVGQSELGGPVEIDSTTWQKQFTLNLDTAYFCIKFTIPIMEKNSGGSIVNISSVAGLRYIGKPQVGYSASKAALIQMTKTTAVIEAKKNIRLNCVVPGLMHTPLVERLAKKYADGDYEGFVKRRHDQVPIGRMGESWDVAHAVLFLCSDEAKYITGTEIIVDGGLTAATP